MTLREGNDSSVSDLTTGTENPHDARRITRRSVARGAAWTLPVVALAAAAPSASASTPACPTCLKAGVLGAITTQAVVAGNKGALLFAGALGLDSTNCQLNLFKPLYTSIVTSATLTMSDGSTHTGTGLGSGTGTFGQLGALPGGFLFSNITFPSGTYILTSNPVHPTKISANVTVVLIGLPSLIEIQCPVTLTWTLDVLGVGVVTPAFLGGTGTINFSGTAHVA